MATLLLVRHGESEANRHGFFAGQKDVELLPKGVEQAKKTAEYIAAHYHVSKVYASDLRRARTTGEVIADRLQVDLITAEKLREINAGEWQGKTFDTLVSHFKEGYACWLNDIGNCTCTGGESVKQLGERVVAFLQEVATSSAEETVVIATHATPIRVAQCLLQGFSLDAMKDIPWVSNASITELVYKDKTWEFTAVGNDSHLSQLKTCFPANV